MTPLGTGVEENWKAIRAGTPGIGLITKFDASPFPCRMGGEVRNFHAEDFLDKQQIRRFDVFIHYAISYDRIAWLLKK